MYKNIAVGLAILCKDLRKFFKHLRKQRPEIKQVLAEKLTPTTVEKLEEMREQIESGGEIGLQDKKARTKKAKTESAAKRDLSAVITKTIAAKVKSKKHSISTSQTQNTKSSAERQQGQNEDAGFSTTKVQKRKAEEITLNQEQEEAKFDTPAAPAQKNTESYLVLKGKHAQLVIPGLFRKKVYLRQSYVRLLDLIIEAFSGELTNYCDPISSLEKQFAN